jgi:hypothetical protein
MGKGSSGSSTTVQNTAPPQQFMDAYTHAVQNAQNVASQPFQQYQGNLQAPLSPDQQAAIGNIQSAQGITAPYINSAADYINNSTAPLQPTLQPYQAAQSWWGTQAGLNAQNLPNLENQFFAPANQSLAHEQGIGNQAAGTVSPFQQLGSSQINQYLNPYMSQVVNATQAQFNNQNSQQANQLAGNAVSAGAYGGDREALAQSSLANQQQLAQAPVIAGLESQGYQQAVATAQQQQQAQLANQQAQLQGLGLAGNLYQNNAAGQLQQAGIAMQGAGLQNQTFQNIANMLGQQGQQSLGANEANAWLNSQAGYGMANLGNQALNSTLTGANALMGVGGLEQQQAQQSLNIPYEQYIAAQSWPFQTAGWEANIAEGLGSSAGGTSSTSVPGPSVGSQVLGTGLATAGILGQTGAFGNNGWLTGAGTAGAVNSGAFDVGSAASDIPWDIPASGGGRIPHRAFGGGLGTPIALPQGMPNVPDVSMSIVPQGASPHGGGMNILKNFGSTSQTTGGGPSGGQQAMQGIMDAVKIAALVAAFDRGGSVSDGHARRASGGSAPVSISLKPGSYAGSPSVPHMDIGTGGGTVAPPAGGMGAVNDYLSSTAASAHPPPPPPAPAAPAPAPAAPGPAPGPSMNSEGQQLATPGMMSPYGFQLPVGMPLASGPYGDYLNAFNAGNWPGIGGGAGFSGGSEGGGGGMRRGGEVKLDDGGVPAFGDDSAPPMMPSGGMAPAPTGGGHGDWSRALLYAGLGILGGNSPHFGVNVGRGALQGLDMAERQNVAEQRERHQSESERQAAIRLANEADWHKQQLQLQDKRSAAEAEHWKAMEGNQAAMLPIHQGQLQNSIDRTSLDKMKFGQEIVHQNNLENQGRWMPGYGKDESGNQVSGMYFTPKTGGEPIFHPGVTSLQTTKNDQLQDYRGKQLDLNTTKNNQLQDYRQQEMELKKQALSQAKDLKTQQMISGSSGQVLRSASNIMLANPAIKWDKAIDMATKSQGNVQSQVQPPPLPQQQQSVAPPPLPKPGDVIQGFVFKGGDPGNQANWAPQQ